MISFDSFVNYASALETNATNMNILIPARYSSLKILFNIIVRDYANLADYIKKSVSTWLNLFGEGVNAYWNYSIGGKNIPSTPVKTSTDAAAEPLQSPPRIRRSVTHEPHHPGHMDCRRENLPHRSRP